MSRHGNIGFTVQSVAGNPTVSPTSKLIKASKTKRYTAEYDEKRDEVRVVPGDGPDSFSIRSSFLPKLTEVMHLAGYPIKLKALYLAVQDGDDWRVLRDKSALPKPSPNKPAKIVVVNLEEPSVEVKVAKEYPLPPVCEGTPAQWAEACRLMALGRPKIYIEGLSVNTCLILERSCPVFIRKMREFCSNLQADMANGLAKAVRESWERQLRSKAS